MLSISPVAPSTLPVLEERPLTPRTVYGLPDLSAMQIAAPDDAVVNELENQNTTTEDSTQAGQNSGFLFNALSAIRDIATQLKEMRERLSNAALGSEQAASIETEIAGLNEAYQRAINSDEFRRGTETLAAVQSALSQGASTDALTRSLRHERTLLGGSVVDLVRAGAAGQLSMVTGSLSDLSSVDLTSTSATDSIIASASQALKNFKDTASSAESAATGEPAGELKLLTVPEIKHLTFDAASEVSIGLRSLNPADMLKAAAAHMELDLQRSVILLGPDENKQVDKAEEREKNDRGEDQKELHFGLFYGKNAPVAALVDPAVDKSLVTAENSSASAQGV